MFPYVVEEFTEAERALLARYTTNLDRPTFCLVNLPEVVKGALFARYSRSPKSLRRLLLDEFLTGRGAQEDGAPLVDTRRAEEFYERVLVDFGDDSVAQLGGAHIACEQVSNLLTKQIERGRLAAYLEQSTRYIPYHSRLSNGRYRYFRPKEVLGSPLGARYVADMDRLFDSYAELLSGLQVHLQRSLHPPEGASELAWRRALRARALDSARWLLPAATLSNVGMFASGQAYEGLLVSLQTSPLPEAQAYGRLMQEELEKVISSFVSRVSRPDRGQRLVSYLTETKARARATVRSLGARSGAVGPYKGVRLVDFDPDGEVKIAAAIFFELGGLGAAEALEAARSLDDAARSNLIAAYAGERANRRHKPGRAFEATEYLFEIVTDYGAFRDLQRHRMCSMEWQELTPKLGYELPADVEEAGLAKLFHSAMERSAGLYEALVEHFEPQAAYALSFAWRIRFTMRMNAREAMHVIELRSSPQGHPSYREVALEMKRLIAEVAGHRAVSEAMRWAGHGDGDLGRLEAEQRSEARRAGLEGGSQIIHAC
jgi:thymidylate synthase ThyX